MSRAFPERVPPSRRRKRDMVSGLYFAQARAIRSLPIELWSVLADQARGWSCARTSREVSAWKKRVSFADVDEPSFELREQVIELIGATAASITLPTRPATGPACADCGRTFRPRRADARYCSGACRQRAYRRRRSR